MNTQRHVVISLIVIPLLIPCMITLSMAFMKPSYKKYVRSSIMGTQNEYSFVREGRNQLDRVAVQTIRVVETTYRLPEIDVRKARVFKAEKRFDADPAHRMPRVKPKNLNIQMAKVNTHSGKVQKATFLNLDPVEGMYHAYSAVEGRILFPNGVTSAEMFIEVSFLDRVGSDGLDEPLSSILAAREVRNEMRSFILRLPSETQGYLVAKAYLNHDQKKETPVYIGTYMNNPLSIPRRGVSNIEIMMMPTQDYLALYQTRLAGRIMHDYGHECLTGVDVWVLETKQHTRSDKTCSFEFRGLRLEETYHLIFEADGFMTQQIPVEMIERRISKQFTMLPLSKFKNGYDIFLGPRMPSRSLLFAQILKEGKPLSRAIVGGPDSSLVVYERDEEGFSLPDTSLYSTSTNGRFTLWNAKPGKNRLEIFYNGEQIATHNVKLSPGILHYLKIDLP